MTKLSTDALWMPFTANRAYKAAPKLVKSAKGVMLYTDDQREVIDGTAGLWCVNAGHCREEIAEAVNAQLRSLDYTSVFNFGHELEFEYANRLVQYTPDGLDHVFFGNSGSEAVDTALKLCMQYWVAKGEGQRKRFISRQKGYHGVNFGGVSMSGLTPNHKSFGQWLMVDHLRHTLDIERNAFSKGLPGNGIEWAEELDDLLTFHGAETVAAVIIEPIAGAGGVILPPEGYLKRIREICDRHNVLLIFDEVICGWGRTGNNFAASEFEVTPDLMTSAKGITNAAIPLSAVFIDKKIYQTCMDNAETPVEFFHGYTYSCHPVACAAGMATLDVYDQEGLLTRAKTDGEIGRYWQDALHSLSDLPQVVDVRNYGLVGAVQLDPGQQAIGTLGAKAMTPLWESGLMVRGIGDAIAMSPPLIIEKHHIDKMAELLRKTIPSLY